MKILHVCLAQFYIDDYGYQENVLPKMHVLSGHNVKILASTETYIGTKLGYIKPGSYLNENKIPVTRIPYYKFIPKIINKKLRIYSDVYSNLSDFKPDIIFMHDLQFLSIIKFRKFLKKNKNIKLYIDGHTDFINSARNIISKYILHKIIYKYCAKSIEPFTTKFYGTLPLRCDFFINVYGINKKKVSLLEFGVDSTKVIFDDKDSIRLKIREKLHISNFDFVLITGGKIDERKKIINIVEALKTLNIPKIKLIIFGKPNSSLNKYFEELKFNQIIQVGWLNINEINKFMLASDIVIFPGTHSVLWEHSIGLGLPGIFLKWNGIQHIDLGGNCYFLENSNVLTIKNAIYDVYKNKQKFEILKNNAVKKGIPHFSYFNIANRSIEMTNLEKNI